MGIRAAYVVEAEGDDFASAVAVTDGSVLVRGPDERSVTAYVLRDNRWSPQVLKGPQDGLRFGYSLALHGKLGFVGARPVAGGGGGAIQVIAHDSGRWEPAGFLISSRPEWILGSGVAAIRTLVIASLLCAEGTALEIFGRNGDSWRSQGIATVDRRAVPSPIAAGDDFVALRERVQGAIVWDVSLEGEVTMSARLATTFQGPAIGLAAASQRVFVGGGSGQVDVFERSTDTEGWVRSAGFAAPPECESDGYLSANRAGTVILPCARGKALVFRAAGASWTLSAELEAPLLLPYAVAGLSDVTAVIGVPDAGVAYFYHLPPAWAPPTRDPNPGHASRPQPSTTRPQPGSSLSTKQ